MNNPAPYRIVLSRPMPKSVEEAAVASFDALLADHVLSRDELVERAASHAAEGLLFSGSLRLDRELLQSLPTSLRVAATVSVGFDHIDVQAATARGVIVTNSPVVTECTADLTLLHILAACRRAREHLELMKQGWDRVLGLEEMLGTSVSGKTLALVGMGRIGQAVAQRARAFGVRIVYHNRARLPADQEQGAIYFATLDAMLPHAQILSLHLPADRIAPPLMGREQFALLPTGAVFANTARGSLVDEDALCEALESGRVAAAGLDVFSTEPAFNRRFLDYPQVFLTPHAGSATVETRRALGLRALANIEEVLGGRNAIDPL